MDIFKLVGSIFVDTDEANKSLSKTGESVDNTASKLSSFGETAGKVAAGIGAAAVAVGGAVLAVSKDAVENYAEYEQAVGGIETLFGETADKVIETAKNAYKNAGVNATQYMETVTSFTASLLQGLDGDTEKAAVIADEALVDMSDNANKFGTSIESVQNAYMGFAKNNYTMLDNLKLGYGGTKAEMERLIADANELAISQGLVDESMLKTTYDSKAIKEWYTELTKREEEYNKTTESLEKTQISIQKAQLSYNEALSKYGAESANAQKALISLQTYQQKEKKLQEEQVEALEQLKNAQNAYDEVSAGKKTAFDMDNFSDVIQAIHLIQENMGITGTTALEAGTTISGMIAMITNKFEDMKTELGESLAPSFKDLLNLVIDNLPNIQNLLNRLIPIIVNLVNQTLPPLIKLSESILPVVFSLIEEILPFVSDLFDELMPIIIDVLNAVIPSLVEIVKNILPIVKTLLASIVPILRPLLALLQPIFELVIDIINPALKLINIFLTPLVNLISGSLVKAFNNLTPVLNSVQYAFSKIFTAIPEIVKGGMNVVIIVLNKAINGINKLITPLRSVILSVGKMFGASWTMDDVKIPTIPMLAKGGTIGEGGSAIVGEAGAELVNLPRGASVTPINDNNNALSALESKLDSLIEVVQNIVGTNVVLDSGVLVGQLAPAMDKRLGYMSAKELRRV